MQTLFRCNNWIAAGAAIAVYWFASGGMLELTVDSYFYLSAAKSWAVSKQLVDYQGNVYANWPPLYPILLSLGYPEMMRFAFWLHGIAYAISAWLFAHCLGQYYPRPLVHLAAALSYALYAPLVASAIFLWSEIIFMAILPAAFWAFLRKKDYKMLIIYVMLANLLCLQRNAGIFFVIAWTFSNICEFYPSWRQILKAILVGLTASLAFIFWQWRNLVWLSKVHDFRENAGLISLLESIRLSFSAMSTWTMPILFPEGLRIIIFVIFVMVMTLFLTKRKHPCTSLRALALTFICYCVGMWSLRMNIPSENDRYFLPLFPFFLMSLGYFLQQVQSKKLAIGCMMLLTLYHTGRGVKNSLMWHNARCSKITTYFQIF